MDIFVPGTLRSRRTGGNAFLWDSYSAPFRAVSTHSTVHTGTPNSTSSALPPWLREIHFVGGGLITERTIRRLKEL